MSKPTGDQHPAGDQSETDAQEGSVQLDQMRAAVADEVANLLSRLPDNAGLLELTMAEGIDPAGLEQLLASLPDTEELAALAASLNDPEALARLLATNTSEADPPDGTE